MKIEIGGVVAKRRLGRRGDGGPASPGVGRHRDGHCRAWQGPAGHRFQRRRGCGVPGAEVSRFSACPRVVRCGAGRTSGSRSIATARSTPPPVPPLRLLLAGGAQPSSDRELGPPEPGGDPPSPVTVTRGQPCCRAGWNIRSDAAVIWRSPNQSEISHCTTRCRLMFVQRPGPILGSGLSAGPSPRSAPPPGGARIVGQLVSSRWPSYSPRIVSWRFSLLRCWCSDQPGSTA